MDYIIKALCVSSMLCVVLSADEHYWDVTLNESIAKSMLPPGGRRLRQKRSVTRLELGPDDVITKPSYYTADYLPNDFTITIKELREVTTYPDAWTKKPDNFRFDYLPSGGQLEENIVNGAGDELALIDIIYKDRYDGLLVLDPDDDFFTLYWRYAQCKKGVDEYRNCPDPCKKELPCGDVANSLGHCTSTADPGITVDLAPHASSFWKQLFQNKRECSCENAHAWHAESQTCRHVGQVCQVHGGTRSPCRNGGRCHPVGATMRFTCTCPPAYEGAMCENPRNPCRYPHTCDTFPCVRSPGSWRYGYQCRCDSQSGFEQYSEDVPRCQDIDECKNFPCTNGGTCVNTVGNFRCDCPTGWVGRLCEHRDYVEPEWGEWGVYDRCSITCGPEGIQYSYRECDQAGQCVGTNSRRRQCTDIPRHCTDNTAFDDSMGMTSQHGANTGVIDQSRPQGQDYSNFYSGYTYNAPATYYNNEDDVLYNNQAQQDQYAVNAMLTSHRPAGDVSTMGLTDAQIAELVASGQLQYSGCYGITGSIMLLLLLNLTAILCLL